MKILHILSSDDKYGSAKSFLELLDKEIQEGTIPCVVLPKKNKIFEYCQTNHISCYYLSYQPFQIPKHNCWWVFLLKYIYRWLCYHCENPRVFKQLQRIVQKEKPDIVHTNTSVIDMGAKLNQSFHIPHVWHLREFGKEDYHFQPFKRDYISYMNKYSSRFIAISEVVQKAWIQKGLDPQKIEIICHGVDGRKFAHIHPSERDFHVNQIKLVMCGSFGPAKGQIKVLHALSMLTSSERAKMQIDFYGKCEGVYYNKFKSEISRLNLQNVVQIKGYCENLPQILSSYDAAIMYSRAEAMGRVTIEYMFAGLCPIVPRRGANIEIIEQNQSGLLFDYDDERSLTKILRNIIKDPKLLQKYAQTSYRVSREKYDSNKNIPHIISLFREIAKSKNS